MAKNRKSMSGAIRFGPAIKALLLCSLFVVSGVGYVWQKSLIADLNRQLKTHELALAEYRDRNKKLAEQLAGLKSPELLKERMRKSNLGLELPRSTQVWWLPEPAGPRPARPPAAVQRYAARP
jgi:hypothetical protein